MRKKSPEPFKKCLSCWRSEARLTQGEVEMLIDRGKGYISKLESGFLGPPDKGTCTRLAEALGQSVGDVWGAAARDRLRGFDADLLDFLRDEVRDASEFRVGEWESYLLLALRHICEGDDDLMKKTARLLEAIAYAESSITAQDLPRANLVRLVQALDAAPSKSIEVFLSTMALWAEALPEGALK